MKDLRLVLFEECNRSCAGCVNNDWDIQGLPVAEEFSEYNSIMLTGGEPMLRPQLIIDTVARIREDTDAPIVMYTAKSKRALDLIAMLHILDGVTLTLHEQYDVPGFKKLNDIIMSMGLKKSLRLNVFKGIDLIGINTSYWQVKDNIVWLEDCPLPENEVLMRL